MAQILFIRRIEVSIPDSKKLIVVQYLVKRTCSEIKQKVVVGAVDVLSEAVISALVVITVVLWIVPVAILAMVVITVDVVSVTTATVDVVVIDVLIVTVLPMELVDSMVVVLLSAAWLVVDDS